MQTLKAVFYALLAFLAAVSVNVGPGGAVLLQLPPLAGVFAHLDLYAAGLLALVEVFTRLVPSASDTTVTRFVTLLLNSLIPNRAEGGGSFTLQSVPSGGLAV